MYLCILCNLVINRILTLYLYWYIIHHHCAQKCSTLLIGTRVEQKIFIYHVRNKSFAVSYIVRARKGGIRLFNGYSQADAENFFNQEYPYLYRYAVYLVKDESTAQDLCQETFIRWYKLSHPREIEMPRAWLKKVLSNLAWNHLRHQKIRLKRETGFHDSYLPESTDMTQDLTRIEVEDVLASLPRRDQLLLKMKMAGLSYAEIAEIMNVSKGSVGTILMRAMNKFKTLYAGKEVTQEHEVSKRRPTITLFGGRTGN